MGECWEHVGLMPTMVVSRVMVDVDTVSVVASVKTKLFKKARELPQSYPGYTIKLAKEAGFEVTNGLVTGSWYFSLE